MCFNCPHTLPKKKSLDFPIFNVSITNPFKMSVQGGLPLSKCLNWFKLFWIRRKTKVDCVPLCLQEIFLKIFFPLQDSGIEIISWFNEIEYKLYLVVLNFLVFRMENPNLFPQCCCYPNQSRIDFLIALSVNTF